MNKKTRKEYTTPWQFPFDTPQLPKYGYDRPFSLPPPPPDIYSNNVGDLKERSRGRNQNAREIYPKG